MKELPKIDILPVHELILPISKSKALFSPYTVEQERNILTAFEADDSETVIENYKKLLLECFQEPIDFTKQSAQEFLLMAINLRAKSKGEVLDITTTCKKCEKGYSFSVNIEDGIVVKNEDKIKDICKISDDLSFEVVPVRMGFLSKISKMQSESDLMLETATHSISKVFWKDEIFTDFTPETLQEKVTFTYPILKEVFATANGLIKMFLMVKAKCPDKECAHEEEYTIRDFLKYLI